MTGPAPTVDREHEADLIAGLALGCSTVAELSLGGWRRVATYLPGRAVAGVRVDEVEVTVSVVLEATASVGELDRQLRAALAPVLGARRLHIYVADVAVPVVAPLMVESEPVPGSTDPGLGQQPLEKRAISVSDDDLRR